MEANFGSAFSAIYWADNVQIWHVVSGQHCDEVGQVSLNCHPSKSEINSLTGRVLRGNVAKFVVGKMEHQNKGCHTHFALIGISKLYVYIASGKLQTRRNVSHWPWPASRLTTMHTNGPIAAGKNWLTNPITYREVEEKCVSIFLRESLLK